MNGANKKYSSLHIYFSSVVLSKVWIASNITVFSDSEFFFLHFLKLKEGPFGLVFLVGKGLFHSLNSPY